MKIVAMVRDYPYSEGGTKTIVEGIIVYHDIGYCEVYQVEGVARMPPDKVKDFLKEIEMDDMREVTLMEGGKK